MSGKQTEANWSRLVWWGIALLLFGCSSSEPKVDFNIPRQSAEVSLKMFAEQASVEIVFDANKVAGITTNSVYGIHDSMTSIGVLLKGTGLGWEIDPGSDAFAVFPIGTSPNQKDPKPSAHDSVSK
ncbi:MAG: hypothetical protein SynsKO_31970 [Synoicihabitans sp.]